VSSRKGTKGERELSNWLEDEAGWYAQRLGVPAAPPTAPARTSSPAEPNEA